MVYTSDKMYTLHGLFHFNFKDRIMTKSMQLFVAAGVFAMVQVSAGDTYAGLNAALNFVSSTTAQTHDWSRMSQFSQQPQAMLVTSSNLIDIDALVKQLNAEKVSDAEFDQRIAHAEKYNANMKNAQKRW
jgi:hypothetical protein